MKLLKNAPSWSRWRRVVVGMLLLLTLGGRSGCSWDGLGRDLSPFRTSWGGVRDERHYAFVPLARAWEAALGALRVLSFTVERTGRYERGSDVERFVLARRSTLSAVRIVVEQTGADGVRVSAEVKPPDETLARELLSEFEQQLGSSLPAPDREGIPPCGKRGLLDFLEARLRDVDPPILPFRPGALVYP